MEAAVLKLISKQFFIFIVGVAIMIGSGYLIGGDRYLPWVKKEVVYVVLNTEDAIEVENGRTIYKAIGINTSGEQRAVIFEVLSDIQNGEVLKLHSKGNYTSSVEIIHPSNIPQHLSSTLF